MSLRYVLELDGDFFYSRNFETDELKGLCKDGGYQINPLH